MTKANEWPKELQAKAGERLTPEGKPIRSNTAWRKLAEKALGERDSLQAELVECRASLAEWHGEAKAADSARKAATDRLDSTLESALVFGSADDESRACLAELASILATLPLAVLASADDAGKLARLYLKAELLTGEEPRERFERLKRKLAESGE